MATTADMTTDLTYDEAKEFVFACNLKFQTFLPPPSRADLPITEYGRLAHNINYGPSLEDDDDPVRSERNLAVVRGVFDVAQPARFEHKMLNRAFAVLK